MITRARQRELSFAAQTRNTYVQPDEWIFVAENVITRTEITQRTRATFAQLFN